MHDGNKLFIVWIHLATQQISTYHIFLDGSKALDYILGWVVITHRLSQSNTTLANPQDKYRGTDIYGKGGIIHIFNEDTHRPHLTHRDEEHHDDTL